ncbi:MAG: hypothetical protein K9K38_03220 [Rhodoferax sp.]|nr:hypothetical protein [Rhodoferax sp.]
MSFLNQLKSQASALQSQQSAQTQSVEENTAHTELASKTVWLYVSELAKQLNVIAPDGPKLSLDGKTQWPAMRLTDFRADARKKQLRSKDVYDYIAMGWQMLPKDGPPVPGAVSVNFPPDLERVEKRLSFGSIKHERKDVRHPEKNTLQAIRFEYLTQARGNVTITADHDKGQLLFRLANTGGFEILQTTVAAQRVNTELLDEMAKMIVGQPSRFL